MLAQGALVAADAAFNAFDAYNSYKIFKFLGSRKGLQWCNPWNLCSRGAIALGILNTMIALNRFPMLQLTRKTAGGLRGRVSAADGIKSLNQLTSLSLSLPAARREPPASAHGGEIAAGGYPDDRLHCPLDHLTQPLTLRLDGYAIN